MMKRLIAMLLAVLMLLSLVGCGTETSEEDPTAVKIEALLAEGDFENICNEVATIAECQQVILSSGIEKGSGEDVKTAFTEKNLRPKKIIELCCMMLDGDYEEVGCISTMPRDKYFFLCVKKDGNYCLYDILGFFLPETTNLSCLTQSEVIEDVLAIAADLRADFEASYESYKTLKASNGEVLLEATTCGVPTFSYAGTTIPVGLGLPKLTDEEIDALLAENDPRKVKETITTLADFVNYCYRGEFIFGDGLIFFMKENGRYVQTTSSGYQTLQMRMGQCASMSSCLHYVLDDDYDETGYVLIDQHIMTYILCDGLYYLVNPVEYVFTAYDDYEWSIHWSPAWLDYIAHGDNGMYCSSDFQDIADSLYGRIHGNAKITYVYTVTSPGDHVSSGFSFPEGTNATCWYGNSPDYLSFTEYDWMSQENIVDRDAIVMFPPPDGQWVPFGGIHEDSYTGEQYPNSYLK